jgi:1-acyl-sn-glycerol-3-phosphate acyltransferase
MGGLRNLVGSALFNLVFLPGTAVAVMGMILLLPFPRMAMQWAVRNWSWVQHWALKVLVGLDFEVRGRENIAGGAAIYASKHQSAWDTYAYYLLFPDPAYIMKVELMRIPVWGWMAKKCEAISVDRAGGAGALKTLVRDVKNRLAAGRQVIIFPEGTRTEPGRSLPYQPGIAALYSQCDAPVVPVALNSGLFWGRRNFRKQPGSIIIEFLPAIPAGLRRREFMQTLESRIEEAADRLADEARASHPWLPAPEDAQDARVDANETTAEPERLVD